MKKLKKGLSLLLVLAMVFSLATTAFAGWDVSKYEDADEITQDEAVAVMTGLGVIEGDETTGLFDPTGTYTREAAAKVLTYMLLGPTAAEQLTATTDPFDDVPATRWSAGCISYLAGEGIIEGYGDGNFGPEDELSQAAWLKMILCAMGYDADKTGMGNTANWAAKAQSLAVKSTLLDGKDLALDWDRETAVYYAFKAVEKNKNLADSKDETLPFIVNVDSNGKTAGTDKKTDVADEYGRPAYYYTTSTRDKAYATGTEEADLVIENEVVKNADLIKALGLTQAQANVAVFTVYEDGLKVVDSATSLYTGGRYVTSAGHFGTTVEFYKTSGDGVSPVAYTVVEINTHVAKIGEIAKDATEVTLETLDAYYGSQAVKVAVGDLKKDDIVSYNIGYDYSKNEYAAYNVTVLEGTQGKVTATGDTYVRIDGEKTELSYKISGEATTVSGLKSKASATFYYDEFGNILYVGNAVVAAKDFDGYVLLKSAESKAVSTSILSAADAEVKYEVVDLATGETSIVNAAIGKNTKGVWVYADKNGDLQNVDATTITTEAAKAKAWNAAASELVDTAANTFYGYYLTEDGSYVLQALTAEENQNENVVVTNKNTATVNAITDAFADANTELTYVSYDAETGYTVTTVTGIANFPELKHKSSNETVVVVKKGTGAEAKKIKTIFVYNAKGETVEPEKVYGVFKAKGEYDAATQTYAYTFIVNGEEKTYYSKSEDLSVAANKAYVLTVGADGMVTATQSGLTAVETPTTVVVAEKTYVVYNTSDVLNLAENCQIVDTTAKQTGYVANAKAYIYSATNAKTSTTEAVVIVIVDDPAV